MSEEKSIANISTNGIIELIFLRENVTLDINEVREGWEKAKALSPNKTAVIHLKTGKWTLLEKEARDFVKNELKTWPAVAIQVDNLGQRLMGQIVINLTGRGNHIKLFDDSEKAKEWLTGKISK